jgi:hypothetical protein
MNNKNAIVSSDYLKKQKAWLEAIGLKGCYSLEHFEVVPRPGGRYILRKREKPLRITADGDDYNGIVASVSKTLGERFFKHEREEDRLEILNPSCNLEVKECLGEW